MPACSEAPCARCAARWAAERAKLDDERRDLLGHLRPDELDGFAPGDVVDVYSAGKRPRRLFRALVRHVYWIPASIKKRSKRQDPGGARAFLLGYDGSGEADAEGVVWEWFETCRDVAELRHVEDAEFHQRACERAP